MKNRLPVITFYPTNQGIWVSSVWILERDTNNGWIIKYGRGKTDTCVDEQELRDFFRTRGKSIRLQSRLIEEMTDISLYQSTRTFRIKEDPFSGTLYCTCNINGMRTSSCKHIAKYENDKNQKYAEIYGRTVTTLDESVELQNRASSVALPVPEIYICRLKDCTPFSIIWVDDDGLISITFDVVKAIWIVTSGNLSTVKAMPNFTNVRNYFSRRNVVIQLEELRDGISNMVPIMERPPKIFPPTENYFPIYTRKLRFGE